MQVEGCDLLHLKALKAVRLMRQAPTAGIRPHRRLGLADGADRSQSHDRDSDQVLERLPGGGAGC